MDSLESVSLGDEVEDRRAWMDDSEEFSVKAMNAALASPGPTISVPFHETVWKSAAPKKCTNIRVEIGTQKNKHGGCYSKAEPSSSPFPELLYPLSHSNEGYSPSLRRLFSSSRNMEVAFREAKH